MLFLYKAKKVYNNSSALHIYYSSSIIMAKLFVTNSYLFDYDNDKSFTLISPLNRELFPADHVKIINRHGKHIFDRVFYSLISSESVGLTRQQQRIHRLKKGHWYYVLPCSPSAPYVYCLNF